ncbi:TonB-dependent receptor [Rhizobium sp. TRM95111]|uniref:TonB-dependent receptor domain-containing protein n=1 Tax=Rhizobium alarense TaxID=2846851 RepID=UPI001F1BB83D|nr:TonB-dependent receptor [Rhizobium alarense]MCF3639029.1 TonB-dependent receptor [Rhizobium alarense]
MRSSSRRFSVLFAGTALSLASSFISPAAAQDMPAATTDTAVDATTLEQITVDGERGDDGVADTPAAVSSADAEAVQDRYAGNINNVVRATPGTFTREAGDQPGVVVNIRGLQGMGRVNSMIDGVPQTFRNLSGHGGTFDNMLYVEENMLVGVDVARGAVSGAEGMGTLAGAANFRTLEVDDVLLPGHDYGMMTTLRAGSNGFDFSRLFAGGLRHDYGGEGEISAVGAISDTKKSAYENGNGEIYPYGGDQHPKSGLFKVNLAPNADHDLTLGGIWYDNEFLPGSSGYNWLVENQTYTAKYAYQPGSDLIDLKANAYLNITDIAFDGTNGNVSEFDGREGRNTTTGFDVSNRMRFDLADDTELTLFYGGAYSHDDYDGNEDAGANPDGTLVKSGVFGEATISRGIFDVTGGLRYDGWSLEGISGITAAGTDGCPAGGSPCPGEHVERSGGDWSPKVTVAARPFDWLQPYVTYAHTTRPPTASEMFYPGGHNFDGTSDPINNNLNLVPEQSRGWDIGINLTGQDLLQSGDSAWLKVGYFHNRIENYITYDIDTDGEARWVNTEGTTVMQGVEVEGGYDAGRYYANFSLTIADTDQPHNELTGGVSDVGTLPDDFFTVDAGFRAFDEALTIGGRVRYVGKSTQLFNGETDAYHLGSYTLFDAYATWKINETAKLFVNVENLFDRSYMRATSGFADNYSGIDNGRGRTIIVGATARF